MYSLNTKRDPWCARLLAIVAAAPLLHCGGRTSGDGSEELMGAQGGNLGNASGGNGNATSGSAGNIGTGTGASGGTIGTGGAGAAAGAPSAGGFPCQNPKPYDPQHDTGLVQCDGFEHRPEAVACLSLLPRPKDWISVSADTCEADTDCTAQPYGHCSPSGALSRICKYGCTEDADCGSGICVCGPFIGKCVTASCTSDFDCLPGRLCASYSNYNCSEGFACQRPDDECMSDVHCGLDHRCSLELDGVRRCRTDNCGIVGRPFLIDDAPRIAEPVTRADFESSEVELDARGLAADERAALGAAWLENALMEHASIAAFARFTLELLAVGAPADLIRDSNTAASDETRHAELCFALASAYLGEPVGPGPLQIDGALEGISLEKLVVTTILEGCIGETVAAIEAAEQLAHASDPAVRRVLSCISEDETRHAELAWRFVKWAIERDPTLRLVAAREFERHLSATHSVSYDADLDLGLHGILPGRTRTELRRAVLEQVVRPSAIALLRQLGPSTARPFVRGGSSTEKQELLNLL